MVRRKYMPDLLEEHFEECQFLWGRRLGAVGSPEMRLRDVAEIDARIAAHEDGLRVAGDDLPEFLEASAPHDGDPLALLTRTHVLLASPTGVESVLSLIDESADESFAGVARALGLARRVASPEILASLEIVAAGEPGLRAALACETLAVQGRPLAVENLRPLLLCEDAAVREVAWRVVASPAVEASALAVELCAEEVEPAVLAAAIRAGCWRGRPEFLGELRRAVDGAHAADLELLRLLAVVGDARDRPGLEARLASASTGLARFELAALAGWPELVPQLLEVMGGDAPARAAGAGLAFVRITGEDIATDVFVPLVDDGEDGDPEEAAFEAEFADEAPLPDVARAREIWARQGGRFESGRRFRHGVDVSQSDTLELDLATAREIALRSALAGVAHGRWVDHEHIPVAAAAR